MLERPVRFEPPRQMLKEVWQAWLSATAQQEIAGLERVQEYAGDEQHVEDQLFSRIRFSPARKWWTRNEQISATGMQPTRAAAISHRQ